MPRYHIVVNGELTERMMLLLLPTFTHRVESGRTELTTDIIDQAHLVGVVQELSDLGLETVSVLPAETQVPSFSPIAATGAGQAGTTDPGGDDAEGVIDSTQRIH